MAAIASLEAQRGLARGNQALIRAVDTALPVLREELLRIQNPSGKDSRTQLTVLVADLSGFTALSESMDVENVRNAINAMWAVLDEVIHSWGGRIDQHAGDSLTALFGLPRPRDGDAKRALHAALTMQKELQLFNDRVRRDSRQTPEVSWEGGWPGPSMRIGVHCGPVYFAQAPGGGRLLGANRPTAVGETVAAARRLERLAPVGAVLASEVVYQQARQHFVMREHEGEGPFQPGPGTFYLVTAEKVEAGTFRPDLVVGQVTRLAGRTDQIDQLEMVLQSVIESRTVQLATITGSSGVGKSRLVNEFEGRARFLVGKFTTLHAEVRDEYPMPPFSLVRDILLRRLDIRPQDSLYTVEQKLRRGLMEVSRVEAETSLEDAEFLGRPLTVFEQILDVEKAASTSVEEVMVIIEPLLRAISSEGPALVVIEGLDRADPQSLDLLERLVRSEIAAPVLFLGVTGVSDPVNIPWLNDNDELFSPFVRCDLPALSAVESRLMATQILSPLSPPPMRLLDLIVAESAGSPLYIESFIRLLIDHEAIITGEHWRVDMAVIENFRIPVGLRQLMAARLTKLSGIERKVLELAAVFGAYCWDTALLDMDRPADISEASVETAMLSLELKGFLDRVEIYSFAATQAYAFRRESVRQAAYDGLPPDERRNHHLKIAYWFVANREIPRFSNWFPVDNLIAHHFTQAGEHAQAAAWLYRA